MDGVCVHPTIMNHDGAECVCIATLANIHSTSGAFAEAELIIKLSEPSEVQLKRHYHLSARAFVGIIRKMHDPYHHCPYQHYQVNNFHY